MEPKTLEEFMEELLKERDEELRLSEEFLQDQDPGDENDAQEP
jgi:hypothetical protein